MMPDDAEAQQHRGDSTEDFPPFETGVLEDTDFPLRTSHPYAHLKSELIAPTSRLPPSTAANTGANTPAEGREYESAEGEVQRRREGKSASPSESGTEADDESYSYSYIKALPPPPLKPRKGWRGAKEGDALTPTGLENELIRLSDLGIHDPRRRSPTEVEEERAEHRKHVRERRGEILRRVLEGALLVGMGALVLFNQGIWWNLTRAEKRTYQDGQITKMY